MLQKNVKDMALAITDANFDEIAASDRLVVIDFWAQWCGPCKTLSPIVDELAQTYEGKAIIGKVDVDSNPDIVEKYGVRSIPTVIFLKGGKQVDKTVGALPKPELMAKIEANL